MRAPHSASRAFTIIEVMAGLCVLALITGVAFFGLMQLNNYASVNRLYTAAQTLAQNQIDLILTKAPYDPASNKFPIPNVLQTGGYYSDPSNPNTLYPSNQPQPVTIFKDPSTNNVIVNGTIRTDITTPAVAVGGVDLNMRQATVTVQYTFHGKTYSVKMDTMRAPDV
jgi:type II secretory pathway pseudopilin PulG